MTLYLVQTSEEITAYIRCECGHFKDEHEEFKGPCDHCGCEQYGTGK